MTFITPLVCWLFLMMPSVPAPSVYMAPGEAEYDHAVIELWMRHGEELTLDEFVRRRVGR